MFKLYCLTIVLVAYAPLSAFADLKLQRMSDIVAQMAFIQMESNGQVYNCTPSVNIDGEAVSLSFQTVDDAPNTDELCDGFYNYMANGVGDATYWCAQTSGNKVTIVFESQYDPNAPALAPLQQLASVLGVFPKPVLGGWPCVQRVVTSESSWTYINIQTQLDGTDYQTACNDIKNYLIQGQFLADTKSRCSLLPTDDALVLDLWMDE